MVSIESCENLNFLSLKISKKKFYGLKESIKSENIKKAKESRSWIFHKEIINKFTSD